MLRNNRGFTLIEMLVVIAVLGLILALLSQYAPPHLGGERVAAARLAARLSAAHVSAIARNRPVTEAGITFEPDGTSSGGVFAIGHYTVSADWLTGQVTVHGP